MSGLAPTSVRLPPRIVAKPSGMSMRESGVPVPRDTRSITGRKSAAAPMFCMNALMTPAVSELETTSLLSLSRTDALDEGRHLAHDADAIERRTDDHDGDDGDDRVRREAVEDLTARQHACEPERDHRDHGGDVDADGLGDEQDDGDREDHEDEEHVDGERAEHERSAVQPAPPWRADVIVTPRRA
jgi:hypothetical protein